MTYPQGFKIDTTYGRGPQPIKDERKCDCRLGHRCEGHKEEATR